MSDNTRANAVDLGNITSLAGPEFPNASLDGDGDSIDYFRFTLTEAKKVGLGLRRQDANADLFLEDADGNVLYSSTETGTANEWLEVTLLAGTYYVRVEAQEAGENNFKLRYGVTAADPDALAALEQQQVATDAPPAFGAASYAFALAENADGSTNRISLGTVSATDPEDATVSYSIEGGNTAGLFEIDAATGALSYTGAGEDYESGATSYALTLRASDSSLHSDTTVTVNVTDVVEVDPPQVGVSNAEGHESEDGAVRFRVTLDRAASNPVTVRYETVDGTATAGEDYEASSGELTFAAGEVEKWVEVTLIDDTVEDGGETFGLRLSEVTGAVLGDAEGVGTILNTEPPVSVSEPAGMDFAAGASTTGSVVVGESVTGDITTAGDRDWFAVTLEAGMNYRIDLKGSSTGRGTLPDPELHGIHDSDGNRIAGTTNDDGGIGDNSHLYFMPDADGTYYVAAGAGGYQAGIGTYELSVTSLTDDYAADTTTTGAVTVGDTVTGEIETGRDRDWFAVTLEAGTTYRIDLKGSSRSHGTLLDPYLRGIHDSDGNLIDGTTNDQGGEGNNSRVYFTPGADGTYYVAAGSYLGDYSGIPGTYELSVTIITDDYAADTTTTGAVTVGGSVTGEIETGLGRDRDWFAVTLEAGTTYRIDLEGSETSQGTLYDPYLYGIYNSHGSLMDGTTNDDGGGRLNSHVQFTPNADGTYYIVAGGYMSRNGTYRLAVVEDIIQDDNAAATYTTGAVAVDGFATGEIERSRDNDWFAATLEAGATYRIDLEGSSTDQGTLYNPYLRGIHDSDGNLVAGTTDDNAGTGLNSRIDFTPDADGTYYIAAGSVGTFGTETEGAYRLSVADVTDDYAAATHTTGAVTVGDSATGELELSGDRDWIAVTLEAWTNYRIDLEGAPTNRGTLSDPYLYGIHDANGNYLVGRNDDGGEGLNSRVTFMPVADGTYYIAAGAYSIGVGTYEVSVEEVI